MANVCAPDSSFARDPGDTLMSTCSSFGQKWGRESYVNARVHSVNVLRQQEIVLQGEQLLRPGWERKPQEHIQGKKSNCVGKKTTYSEVNNLKLKKRLFRVQGPTSHILQMKINPDEYDNGVQCPADYFCSQRLGFCSRASNERVECHDLRNIMNNLAIKEFSSKPF